MQTAQQQSSGPGAAERPKLPTPPAHLAAVIPDQDIILRHPTEAEYFSHIAPEEVEQALLPSFDPGVFNNELLKLRLYPTIDPSDPSKLNKPKEKIVEGTYRGTQLALTEAYSRIERTYASLFDVLGFEPSLPRLISLEDQRKLYQFSEYPKNADGTPAPYPPHLVHIPPDQEHSVFSIFDTIGLFETRWIMQKITPDGFIGRTAEWLLEKSREAAFGDPEKGLKIQDVVDYNKDHRKSGPDLHNGGNIGLLDDWYSDRRFADQQFTGTNPVTITKATPFWIAEFKKAAEIGGYDGWAEALSGLSDADSESLFIQDGSYLRQAIGESDPEAVLSYKPPAVDENWAVGAVSLFRLHEDGKLHPIAICVDYKGSIEKSVTIFNRRMAPSDPTDGEKEDWPWRYAKTAAQVTDWMRHEMAVHLTLSHLVEEAIIVATNRTIPMTHPVYELLSPHWYKTLSLNAAARATLVPQIITDLVGITPDQCDSFIRHAYDTYDFVRSYVPNDLERRGFPNTLAGLEHPRYKNYPYAKDILALWLTVRKYVKSKLLISFRDDASVAADRAIQDWVQEVKTAAFMPSFPNIATIDELVDAVTMCIHIASPFHNAVNYLQNFYQAFVAAKPPSLCKPPPKTLDELRAYTETDLVAALPMNRQRQWMLAAQVPWLLSFRVEPDRSLLNYAASQWNVYRYKTDPADKAVREASRNLYSDLQALRKVFFHNSRAMDEGSIAYLVLDPASTAVSILI
ncbi:hypothetical protein VTH06DRAFT_7385 [Thermothelomyces fergusii]